MADNTESTESAGTRRPSAVLLLSGLTALLVSVWAFIGPDHLGALGDWQFKWLLVVAAVVVGIALVVSPGRRK